MLKWAVVLFVFTLMAGVLGFGGFAPGLAELAQIVFYIVLGAFLVTIVANFLRGGTPP